MEKAFIVHVNVLSHISSYVFLYIKNTYNDNERENKVYKQERNYQLHFSS
jgi:hypothetical protein